MRYTSQGLNPLKFSTLCVRRFFTTENDRVKVQSYYCTTPTVAEKYCVAGNTDKLYASWFCLDVRDGDESALEEWERNVKFCTKPRSSLLQIEEQDQLKTATLVNKIVSKMKNAQEKEAVDVTKIERKRNAQKKAARLQAPPPTPSTNSLIQIKQQNVLRGAVKNGIKTAAKRSAEVEHIQSKMSLKIDSSIASTSALVTHILSDAFRDYPDEEPRMYNTCEKGRLAYALDKDQCKQNMQYSNECLGNLYF